MAQTFYPITPTEIVPGSAGSWVDMDASGSIPASATGVILHVVNTNSFINKGIGLRKNGSTDDRYADLDNKAHFWAMIGVDGDRVFEAKVESTSDISIYVVGYTISGVTFLTNAEDMSLSSTGSWTDIDCSTEAPNATGLIFEALAGDYDQFGLRKNGSTDDRHSEIYYHYCFGAVIGCDGSQVCEGYINSTNVDFFLVGYITDGVTFNTNATDLSLGSTGSWTDLTALPDESPVMGIIEVNIGQDKDFGLRKNGSAEDIYLLGNEHAWGIVECDEDRKIEGKIEDTHVDFFLIGYATEPGVEAPTVTTQAVSSIGTTTATGHGNITDDGGETPSAWGICVGTSANPDTGDDVFAGSGDGSEGAFTASMTGLTPGTKLFLKAYATNSAGTSYGSEVIFFTPTHSGFALFQDPAIV
ncbi:hypothetical protein KKE60_08520 [Patescibacteria group bacterium]|nr:hypothetical protein [Patescibacteria group bacterium]